MAARGGQADSKATKQALLDAAQKLFSEQGIETTSLRAVQRHAGLAPGTLQYHFSSREDLVKALLARQQAGLNEKVVQLATQLHARKQTPSALSIIEALALPYIEFLEADPVRGPHYVKIIAQLAHHNERKLPSPIGNLGKLFPELLARAYPDATKAELTAAMLMAARTLLFLLASYAIDGHGKRSKAQTKKMKALLRFVAGGLDAALSGSDEGTDTALRKRHSSQT